MENGKIINQIFGLTINEVNKVSRVKIVVNLISKHIWKLDEIGARGIVSNGHRQSFDYCLDKAIDEFIKKYGKLETEDWKDQKPLIRK